MSDCIVEIKEPLIMNCKLLKPKRIFGDKPIHSLYAWTDPTKSGLFLYHEKDDKALGIFFDEPFYIGQTSNLEDRKRSHLKDSYINRDNNHLKSDTFNRIRFETGQEPNFVILYENIYLKEANELEKKFIKAIGRHDLKKGPLTNMTDGGDNNPGKIWSEESRLNISGENNYWWGKKGLLSPRFGFKYSKEHCDNLSKIHSKNVYHFYDPNGNKHIVTNLRDWKNEKGFNTVPINDVLHGKNNTFANGWWGWIEGLEHLVFDGSKCDFKYVIFDRFDNIYYADSIVSFRKRMNLASNTLNTYRNNNIWVDGFKAFDYERRNEFVNDWNKYKITNVISGKIYYVNKLYSFVECFAPDLDDSGLSWALRKNKIYKKEWKVEQIS